MPPNQLIFENIQISPLLLSEFFAHHLVIIDPQIAVEALPALAIVETQVAYKEPVKEGGPVSATGVSLSNLPMPVVDNSVELVWLGSFARNILVLVKADYVVHLGDSELDLLAKVLMSVKLSLNDVALVNLHRCKLTLEELMQKLPATQVLLFGIDVAEVNLPMRFPHFQITRWNRCVYLSAPSLSEINKPGSNQIAWKTGLWNGLKEMFKP